MRLFLGDGIRPESLDVKHDRRAHIRQRLQTQESIPCSRLPRGPEGRRKLAGGGAKRTPPDRRLKRNNHPGMGVGTRAPRAPAGAHDFLTARSGGVRSLHSLDHRLISSRPPGGKTSDRFVKFDEGNHDNQSSVPCSTACSEIGMFPHEKPL